MSEGYVKQFNNFFDAIDKEILKSIQNNDSELTLKLCEIHQNLWNNYKEENGTSAGFHGISEYIVFSAFKSYIIHLNNGYFKAIRINKDLKYFKLEKNNKEILIYRSASLTHVSNTYVNRAPDIAIFRKDSGDEEPKPIAIVEIKNYLDKGSAKSALNIIEKVGGPIKNTGTKYAIFSYGGLYLKEGKVLNKFKGFDNGNNFLILNSDKSCKDCKITDLSEFLRVIKNDVKI